MDETVDDMEDQNEPGLEQTSGKRSRAKTYPNGLVIEELAMGKPDGEKASSGKKVSVRYIGKLKNGNIFDSNVGGPPFKFHLGLGQVIPGWDVGVNGFGEFEFGAMGFKVCMNIQYTRMEERLIFAVRQICQSLLQVQTLDPGASRHLEKAQGKYFNQDKDIES